MSNTNNSITESEEIILEILEKTYVNRRVKNDKLL